MTVPSDRGILETERKEGPMTKEARRIATDIQEDEGLASVATRHKPDCQRVFKHYDQTCPRCRELAAGSLPRPGWGSGREKREKERTREIEVHFAPGGPHDRGDCGPICTAFDW